MLFHRPTWYGKNIDQGTKFISGTDMSGCLHCCDWICHGTGLRLHTWFTEDLFVFDGRYYRILTSFWFRLNCLSSVLHHREKNLTCWAWLAWWKGKSMRFGNLFLLGIFGGTDLHAGHWTEWNGGSSGMIVSSELLLVCVCPAPAS